jgi:hypothetical protein
VEPIPVTIAGETFLVPRLRVQDIIDLQTLRFDRERRELIEDLEAAGVSSDDRLATLRKHRQERGLSSVIVRAAFSVEGAWSIVRSALKDDIPEPLREMDPQTLSRTALACIGIDLDEMTSDQEGRAEGKGSTSLETGSPNPHSSSESIPVSEDHSTSRSTSSTAT